MQINEPERLNGYFLQPAGVGICKELISSQSPSHSGNNCNGRNINFASKPTIYLALGKRPNSACS